MNLFSLVIFVFLLFFTACSESDSLQTSSLISEETLSVPQTQECTFLSDGSCVNADETLEIYKSYAREDEVTQEMVIRLRGWIYEPNSSDTARSVFLRLLENEIENEVTAPEDINQRIDPFLADNQSAEVIKVLIGSKVYTMDESLSSGSFSGEIRLSYDEVEAILDAQGSRESLAYKVLLPYEDSREFIGEIELVSHDGVIIVSDLDDTIKLSEVYISESQLLENIFYNPIESVEGMSSFLQTLKDENEDPLLFYVSGSPKQMYQGIETFLEEESFPEGFTYLKDLQLSPFTSSFYTFLDENSTYEHKLTTIGNLFEEFPRREFIFVGDSGERDPEVYGALMQEYENRIKAVYIRNVTGETLDNERIQNAFSSGLEKVSFIETDI